MDKLTRKIDDIEKTHAVTASGLNEGEKTLLPCLFNSKILIVAPSEEMLTKYENMLLGFDKKVVAISRKLPMIIAFGDRQSANFKNYIDATLKLAKGDYDAVVVTPDALFQKFPRKNFVLKNILKLKKGTTYSLPELVIKLNKLGYVRQDIVAEMGEFSLRGDILDIYPLNSKSPVRINFFDDEIESINNFDITNFSQSGNISSIEIPPCTFLQDENSEEIKTKIRQDVAKLTLTDESMIRILAIVDNQLELFGQHFSSVSNVFFLPYFSGFGDSIFDYLPSDCRIILDEPKLIADDIKTIEDENISNFLDLSLKGEFLPKHMEFFCTKTEIFGGVKRGFPLLAFSRLLSQNKIFESEHIVNFDCDHVPKYFNRFVELSIDAKSYINGGHTVIICAKNPSIRNKIKTFLDDKNIESAEIKNLEQAELGRVNLLLLDLPYSSRFEMEKLVIIGALDLVAHSKFSHSRVFLESKKFLPEVGQFVVHEVHGIGKCVEIKSIKITNVYRDYIVIEYKNGDKLYVPSENTDLLSNYSGEEAPRLNKIGGAEFYKIKQRVKLSLKQMAFDLIKVYGERLGAKGFAYSKDSYLQSEFESAFPYAYTDDQISALSDIKKDMESARIMDRLLCGDVGFGKTEVALSAAFKVIQDGKQVAFICPTTILSEQHFQTACARMKDFMVEVSVINRFKTKAEQKKILQDLEGGKINLICGTHRLLSSDVKFKDLGLIIVDEEQRFGVEDKEKLKERKRSVDVLSLSATPIPRTLYMSLSGIRDVSFLSTAPKDRKPISTAVIDYSDNILVDACNRELAREGQVLIVYNRVESIGSFYAHIKALLPDAKIGLAHGQMPPKTLESAIFDLYSRKTQVLISTVLIENGIDLPYANTLIVIDADKLGLSQLYQLRGRIGRSDIDAYAYFTFQKNKVLAIDAYKRLDAIMEFSDFGSGYKLALRDLEIRGAGDVLGRNQHGHMQQVGLDLYVKLLSEAVKELRGEKVEEVRDVKLDIALSAFVPPEYIAQNDNRIVFYTKISKISRQNALFDLLKETASKFGSVPQPVEQLCYVGLIKNLAQKVGVKHIVLNDFGATVTFYEDIARKPLYKFLSAPSVDFVLNAIKLPIITLKCETNKLEQQKLLISFLLNCQKFE